ncbi:DNA-binding response regulator [Paractinoplanes abujensis]|uniref:DNA-binding NarL/FixJ family response regulator n=1 Tax=Paractinoplanes abujensis TaxID=882441 RepID=A0A7W7CT83_9ACTN|nr:response regulator transcription factor [Actinoplanes abujensis]MBB4692868.1 DNA-binding NarL/FixJ family response regulator [Actinoplanes abujensis]GID22631.1 DNA-binding response regulator [Actinoplanes abujensis]
MPGETTTVLVADGQPLIRGGLAALIAAAPGVAVAGQAADGVEAVRLARALRPHVVLIDVHLPELDGLAATARILEGAPDPSPRVIILTTADRDEHVSAALRCGASGFLLKEISPEDLLDAIRITAGGGRLFAPSVVRRLVEAYVGMPARPAAHAGLTELTVRELEVLRLVATGAGNEVIAGALFIGEATVKTHLNRLMTKLGLTSRAQVVVLAYKTGLVTPALAGRPGVDQVVA